jgi:hypothetical protein
METRKLAHRVGPVSGSGSDPLRYQKPEFVVVAEHSGRDLAELGELSDT